MRMRASLEQARIVADKVEAEAYDGIPTKKILQMIFNFMKEYRPAIRHAIDLREAISLLNPMPEFERFVQLLLKEHGYDVIPNIMVMGRCIEHEVDAIAKKDDETIMVEVKHHYQHHTYTSLDVFLEAWATFEDLVEGFKLGKNRINFTKVLVVCNTKISEHARRYAACMGIGHIGWRFPEERGLEQMIEEKKLYPITILKALDEKTQEKLTTVGVILLKQLAECNIGELHRETKIPEHKLRILIKMAKEIINQERI